MVQRAMKRMKPTIQTSYSQTPLFGYLIITDSLLCSWEKKALIFFLNSIRTLLCGPSVSVLMRFDCLTKVKNPNWSNLDGEQTSWFFYKRGVRHELGNWGLRVQRSIKNSVTLPLKKRVHVTSSKKETEIKQIAYQTGL